MKSHEAIIAGMALPVNPDGAQIAYASPTTTCFLTNGLAYATIPAAKIKLDAHPEGWRDRPGETPATSWEFDEQGRRSDIQHGANSGRCIGGQGAKGSLTDERTHCA